ncbi:hypothetical protein Acsp02_40810 [Actinoplanes sp. NBRC 103695]|nr:hypothetical protein Acsp02_40810 [Actinoplanes sp. NBRC 103695]
MHAAAELAGRRFAPPGISPRGADDLATKKHHGFASCFFAAKSSAGEMRVVQVGASGAGRRQWVQVGDSAAQTHVDGASRIGYGAFSFTSSGGAMLWGWA